MFILKRGLCCKIKPRWLWYISKQCQRLDSENRVIDGRELEGLEVVLLKDTEQNKPIINAANNGSYADNPFTKTVHVFAHGNPSAFYNEQVSQEEKARGLGTINSGSSLNNVLDSSELWKTRWLGYISKQCQRFDTPDGSDI